MNRILLSVLLMIAALPLAATAQTDRIDQRQANQQKRIDEGINKGELTKSEADRLQKKQQRIQKMENKAKVDGRITPEERRRIERAQDKQSHSIHRESTDKQKIGNEGQRRGDRDREQRERR